MIKYILKRILLIIPVVLGVIVLVFTIIWFSPGDAVDTMASELTTEEEKEQMRHELGLDRPYIVQLGSYIYNVVTKLDLGTAIVNKTDILSDLTERFPNSLRLALFGILFSVCIGIPLGMYAALHQNKLGDSISMAVAVLGISAPGFWLALMLVLGFAYKIRLFPAYGMGGVKYWVLPIAATSIQGIAKLARQTRSSMLEVIRSDYIVMAKSKGLSRKAVIWRHALPNALIPLITVAGMSFGNVLGGGLIIEKVFAIPGVGGYLVAAVTARDFQAVQGAVIMTSFCFCIIMLLCDLLMAFVDPRIKARYSGAKRRKKDDS